VRAAQAGFSLIEVVIATALFAVVALGAFEGVRQLAAGMRQVTARHLAYASLERLTAQLRAEARSATAIWSSAPSAGSGQDDCVQLDFFTADASGPKFWSYRNFPHHAPANAAGGPTGSDDAGNGAAGGDVLERISGTAPLGACDTAVHGTAVLGGLRAVPAFDVVTADALAVHRDAYLGEADSPFVGASVPATAPVPLGVLDASGAPVRGGNALVEVRLETADGSRVADLLPGVFPSGFTEVLRYTCSERCDVGHDTAAPKTLTSCAVGWQPGWSTYVQWNDYATNPDGSLSFPAGWFIGGTFTFTYSGTRASDGGTDTLAKSYAATNWDAARDYGAFPPDRPAPDGTNAGSFAPWDVRSEEPPAWLADFSPYLARGASAAIADEQRRCDAVQRDGASGGFYANG
jgi:prepilin-type N-terminal cleavage/methylation domain-containing protein